MTTVAAIAGGLAGLLHVLFFVMESLLWRKPRVHRVFGAATAADAATLAPAMYNQGFYNLFLAAGAATGVVLLLNDGNAMLLGYTCGFMCAAALVLVGRSPAMWRGALIQGLVPAVALVALALV